MRVGESSESRVQLVLSPLTSAQRERERKRKKERQTERERELRGTPWMFVY